MTRTDTIPANMFVALVEEPAPSTCPKAGKILCGPPFTKDIAMARSMPPSSAFVKNACSLAAELAPLKFKKIT